MNPVPAWPLRLAYEFPGPTGFFWHAMCIVKEKDTQILVVVATCTSSFLRVVLVFDLDTGVLLRVLTDLGDLFSCCASSPGDVGTVLLINGGRSSLVEVRVSGDVVREFLRDEKYLIGNACTDGVDTVAVVYVRQLQVELFAWKDGTTKFRFDLDFGGTGFLYGAYFRFCTLLLTHDCQHVILFDTLSNKLLKITCEGRLVWRTDFPSHSSAAEAADGTLYFSSYHNIRKLAADGIEVGTKSFYHEWCPLLAISSDGRLVLGCVPDFQKCGVYSRCLVLRMAWIAGAVGFFRN